MEEDIPDGNIFVNTVQENMTRYSKRDVKKSTEARRLHGTLHFPSKQTFDWMIEAIKSRIAKQRQTMWKSLTTFGAKGKTT